MATQAILVETLESLIARLVAFLEALEELDLRAKTLVISPRVGDTLSQCEVELDAVLARIDSVEFSLLYAAKSFINLRAQLQRLRDAVTSLNRAVHSYPSAGESAVEVPQTVALTAAFRFALESIPQAMGVISRCAKKLDQTRQLRLIPELRELSEPTEHFHAGGEEQVLPGGPLQRHVELSLLQSNAPEHISTPWHPAEQPRLLRNNLVQVLFATDRKVASRSKTHYTSFTSARDKGPLTYGIAEVSIPATHIVGRLERPTLWKFEFTESAKKHVVISSCIIENLDRWQCIARHRLQLAGESSALLFIHGFNVSFDDAIRRTAQIGFDMQFPGLVTTYSWASKGEVLEYLSDEESVRLTVPRLKDHLLMLRKVLKIKHVHIVAHSMGNRAVVDALRTISRANRIGEVVLAAPDINADLFREAVSELRGKARRYTLYGSENDRALGISKRLHGGYARAGDGGANIFVAKGVETVDASSVGEDLLSLGHSYFSGDQGPTVLNDIQYVVREGLAPGDRANLRPDNPTNPLYWILAKTT